MANRDVLGMREACEFLSVSHMTIRKMCKEGTLPFWKMGNRWKFDRDEIMTACKGLEGSKGSEKVSEGCEHELTYLDAIYPNELEWINKGYFWICTKCQTVKKTNPLYPELD